MKILFFDLETTGVDYKANAIHQLSGEIVIDGETKESFNLNMAPFSGAIITPEALEVAGVTEEQIWSYTPQNEVYAQFLKMLGKYVDKYNKRDKFFLAGYNNAPFDNQFLRKWFEINNDKYFGSWFWANALDVMVLSTPHLAYKRSSMENYKLMTVAKHAGLEVDETRLHDAAYDIYLTKELYRLYCNIW